MTLIELILVISLLIILALTLHLMTLIGIQKRAFLGLRDSFILSLKKLDDLELSTSRKIQDLEMTIHRDAQLTIGYVESKLFKIKEAKKKK